MVWQTTIVASISPYIFTIQTSDNCSLFVHADARVYTVNKVTFTFSAKAHFKPLWKSHSMPHSYLLCKPNVPIASLSMVKKLNFRKLEEQFYSLRGNIFDKCPRPLLPSTPRHKQTLLWKRLIP